VNQPFFVCIFCHLVLPRSKRQAQDIGIAENTAPSGRRPKRTRQDFDVAGYNPAVPGTSMANIYGDLAVWFINNPPSNIIIIRMESIAGCSRVMIELEVDDAA
jgi:hypothetical protein